MAPQVNSTKHRKKKLYQFFSNSSKKIEEKGILPKIFCEATHQSDTKTRQYTTKKENYRPTSLQLFYFLKSCFVLLKSILIETCL